MDVGHTIDSKIRRTNLDGGSDTQDRTSQACGCTARCESQASAAEATAAVLDSLEQALTENDRVTLVGFGTFSVRERAARQMRAIAGENAGQMIEVATRKYVAFKAGSSLEQKIRDARD